LRPPTSFREAITAPATTAGRLIARTLQRQIARVEILDRARGRRHHARAPDVRLKEGRKPIGEIKLMKSDPEPDAADRERR
jgi:hypothetical protein